ncbi:MAG: hypothetical protein P1V20_12415 [Verrucomicrobiales bacterium]|nr:hypothetical protein [Verrucomicrobiales bacterium]
MAEWFFPKLSGGEEHGLNDAGVETFKKEDSLARETCQNIGDVWNQDCGEPAIATFELVQLPSEEFPGRDQLSRIIEACKEFVLEGLPDGTGNEAKFFENAKALLEADQIPLLRIGDENTSGLIGGDGDRQKPFYRLLKLQGASSQQGHGGGTYGIGQRAPFAHSGLRTVIYSSRTPEGVAFIAKSILASFPHPDHGQMTQSKGWWCEAGDDGESWETIRDTAMIPDRFLREKIGTDLWVAGFQSENWEQSVRHSVLRHFFAAIENNQLIVQLASCGEITSRIDSTNLADELSKAADEARHIQPIHEYKKGLGSTFYFHKAITNPYDGKPFTRKIAQLGEVKLFLIRDTKNKEMPDRWATMRKPRIIVEHFGSGILNRFAAVLICDTIAGNKYLAQLEGPEHNRWHDEETRQWTPSQKREARTVLAELRKFVRETLKEVRGASMEEQQDIPFLGRYLPSEDEFEDEEAEGAASIQTEDESEKETGVRRSRPKREIVQGIARKESQPHVEVITGASPGAKVQNGTGNQPGGGNHSGGGHQTEAGEIQALSPNDVRFRAFRSGDDYKMVLESTHNVSGSLHLVAVGEAGLFRVDVVEALDESSGMKLHVQPSVISEVLLEAGIKKKLRVRINSESNLVLAMGE